MNNITNKQFLERLFLFVKHESICKSFESIDIFLEKWSQYLYSVIEFDSLQRIENSPAMDQIYQYHFPLIGSEVTLTFSIGYLLSMFKNRTPDAFIKTTLQNNSGSLTYYKYNCIYTHLPAQEILKTTEYKDLNQILFTLIPATETYVVIDGNHRLCAQIQENYKNVNAYYVNPLVTGASIPSLFHSLLYFFLLDLDILNRSIQQGTAMHIKNQLIIFSMRPTLDTILERKKNYPPFF